MIFVESANNTCDRAFELALVNSIDDAGVEKKKKKGRKNVHLVLSLWHVSHVHRRGHGVCVARLPVPHIHIWHLGCVVITAAETQACCNNCC